MIVRRSTYCSYTLLKCYLRYFRWIFLWMMLRGVHELMIFLPEAKFIWIIKSRRDNQQYSMKCEERLQQHSHSWCLDVWSFLFQITCSFHDRISTTAFTKVKSFLVHVFRGAKHGIVITTVIFTYIYMLTVNLLLKGELSAEITIDGEIFNCTRINAKPKV